MQKAMKLVVALALSAPVAADIPKSIYLTHGPKEGADWATYDAILRELNGDFEIMDFSDDEAAAFIEREYAGTELAEVYAAAPRPVMKADMFRLAVVAKNGGFYLDKDVLAKKNFAPLAEDSTAVFPLEWWKSDDAFAERHFARPRDDFEHFQVGNYAFGAEAGHALVVDALDEAVRRAKALEGKDEVTDLDILRSTGPYMLSEVYHQGRLAGGMYEDATLLRGDDETPARPSDGRTANDWHKFGAYGEHMLSHSWTSRRLEDDYGDGYDVPPIDVPPIDDGPFPPDEPIEETPAPTGGFGGCESSTSWHLPMRPSKDCDWIGKKIGKKLERACKNAKDSTGVSAKDACFVECNTCGEDDGPWKCEDDKNWLQSNEKSRDGKVKPKDCKYIKKRLKKACDDKSHKKKKCKKLTEKECSRVGDDGREAYDACQLTCGTCDAEDAPFKPDDPPFSTCEDNASKNACKKDPLGCKWKHGKCKPDNKDWPEDGDGWGDKPPCKKKNGKPCKDDKPPCKKKNGKPCKEKGKGKKGKKL